MKGINTMSTRDLWIQISDDTPVSGPAWRALDESARRAAVDSVMKQCGISDQLDIVLCNDDGMLYFANAEPIAVDERADFLLDFEHVLKKNIDPGLTVWIEPQLDKNPLRKLRGVTVRSI